MSLTFCRNPLVLLLVTSLHIIGPGFVSSKELSCSDAIPKMVPGARVVRGKDWDWGNQDGTPPTEGTVVRGLTGGWVRVKWENNHTNSYRMGDGDKCDLELFQEITEPTVTSSPRTTQSNKYYSSSVTTSLPESSTSATLPSPTRHQCTCSKEIRESPAKTEAETAELAKEAGRLSVETAKVALEAAKASARAEETKAKEAENALEASKVVLEAAKVALEAAKASAKAEEAKAKEAENALEASKVALEAAKVRTKDEEAERLLALEAKKIALEASRSIAKAEEAKATAEVEVKQVYLEAAKSLAKAEEIWATNAAEELLFERYYRNQTVQSFLNNKISNSENPVLQGPQS